MKKLQGFAALFVLCAGLLLTALVPAQRSEAQEGTICDYYDPAKVYCVCDGDVCNVYPRPGWKICDFGIVVRTWQECP